MNPNKILLYSAIGILALVLYFQFSKERFRTEVSNNLQPITPIDQSGLGFWDWLGIGKFFARL